MFSNSPPNKDIDILVREDNLEVGKNCDVIPDDLRSCNGLLFVPLE